MKRIILLAACLIRLASANAQNGSLQLTFTPHSAGKAMVFQLAIPLLKFDNPHGFWFINPHNGDRHMQFMPDQGWGDKRLDVAFISISEKKDDYSFFDASGNDSNQVTIKNNNYIVSAPEYNYREKEKNKPLHIHINSFTSSECSFSITGEARLATVKDGTWETGTVTGTAHFYREPRYPASDVLPGCDCDPTIYATLYDAENNVRTTSACENALRNKVFDAVQRAMQPLFSNLAFKGSSGMKAGDIDITMIAGHADIKVPVKERPYCSSDYQHNWRTGVDAHKALFNSDDTYGLRFIKMPTDVVLGGGSADPAFMKKQAAFMDSALKLVTTGKMTTEQFEKAQKAFTLRETGSAPLDYKQLEVEHNLYLQVLFNPADRESMLLKLGDKKNTFVQHHVKGASFEIFSGQVKDSDGSWVGNRLFVYLGKFENPVPGKSGGGFDAMTTKAVYPANGNKLNIYSILVKMEGGKDLTEKAMANINFDALLSLITK